MNTEPDTGKEISDLVYKTGAKGIVRLRWALRYSKQGLIAAWNSEEAFRQECILGILLLPLAVFLAEDVVQFILLIAATLIVLITELLNSAIESVVDRIGPDFHTLAGQAKDMGSAAVLISLILAVMTWILIGVQNIYYR